MGLEMGEKCGRRGRLAGQSGPRPQVMGYRKPPLGPPLSPSFPNLTKLIQGDVIVVMYVYIYLFPCCFSPACLLLMRPLRCSDVGLPLPLLRVVTAAQKRKENQKPEA